MSRDASLVEARRLADLVHRRLVGLGRTVAVAESLTGGMVSELLTERPGTSATFRGGLVVYATDLKASLAGVSAADLERLGAVDATVAEQLATGARDRLRADHGVGVTGVAGPAGQDGHEPGEVHVAVSWPGGVSSRRYDLEGSRDDIRTASAAAALSDLVEVLERATRESA